MLSLNKVKTSTYIYFKLIYYMYVAIDNTVPVVFNYAL